MKGFSRFDASVVPRDGSGWFKHPDPGLAGRVRRSRINRQSLANQPRYVNPLFLEDPYQLLKNQYEPITTAEIAKAMDQSVESTRRDLAVLEGFGMVIMVGRRGSAFLWVAGDLESAILKDDAKGQRKTTDAPQSHLSLVRSDGK